MKKEDFKNFIKSHPEFIRIVNSGKTSWQHLYELYDLYGENSNVYDELINNSKNNAASGINVNSIRGVIDTLKELDMDTVKDNLSSIQKAVSFLEDFTAPESVDTVTKNVINPKPLDHFFGD